MQTRKPILTKHRRQRLVLWTLAMLHWFAAILLAHKPITRRELRQRGDISLDWLAATTKRLLVVRAGELANLRPGKPIYWKRGRDLRRRHILRTVLGSRLRRALKGKDNAARIATLINVLRNLDVWARTLAARMRRRLTRLSPITPRPAACSPLVTALTLAPAGADSS